MLDTALYIWDTQGNFHQGDLNVSGKDYYHMLQSSLQMQLANLLVVPYVQTPGAFGKGAALVKNWGMLEWGSDYIDVGRKDLMAHKPCVTYSAKDRILKMAKCSYATCINNKGQYGPVE